MITVTVRNHGLLNDSQIPLGLADLCETMYGLQNGELLFTVRDDAAVVQALRQLRQALRKPTLSIVNQNAGSVEIEEPVLVDEPGLQEQLIRTAPPPPPAGYLHRMQEHRRNIQPPTNPFITMNPAERHEREMMRNERGEAIVERRIEEPMLAPEIDRADYVTERVRRRHPNEKINVEYVDDCLNDVAVDVAAVPNMLYAFKDSMSAAQTSKLDGFLREYAELMNAMVTLKKKMSAITTVILNDTTVGSIMAQIERIRSRMPENKIQSIFFTQRHLVIKTMSLIATASTDGKQYDLGRVMILVPIETLATAERSRMFSIQSLDYVMVDNHNNPMNWLPHVSTGGACYGNAGELIVSALGDRDIITFIDIIIRFIENPNMHDVQGALVTNWREIPNV